jgi:hypothetical protein
MKLVQLFNVLVFILFSIGFLTFYLCLCLMTYPGPSL